MSTSKTFDVYTNVTTGDGLKKVMINNICIYCQAINSKGQFIKEDGNLGEEIIGPCKIIDSKAFYNDILYRIKIISNGLEFDTKDSLIKSIVN